MKKLIIFASALLMCIGLLCSCGAGDSADKSADTVAVVTASEQASEKMKTVHTAFADLKVTEEFFENVEYEITEEPIYTVDFRTKSDKTEIFSLTFGGEGENLLGTLVGEKENTVVYASFASLSEESENYNECCKYQDGINDIINGLVNDYGFIVNMAVEREDNTTFDIETPVVTMKYPNKWRPKVAITVTQDSVMFAEKDGTPLFDLIFKECDGYLLGTYKGTPIYIIDYPFETDEQAAMQEDVNVIIEHLAKDPEFVMGN